MVSDEQIAGYRDKLSRPANYIKEIKQAFSWYYNKRHSRRGTLWGERFKSVMVENGETLINCLAYIDLNPLLAGQAKQQFMLPERIPKSDPQEMMFDKGKRAADFAQTIRIKDFFDNNGAPPSHEPFTATVSGGRSSPFLQDTQKS